MEQTIKMKNKILSKKLGDFISCNRQLIRLRTKGADLEEIESVLTECNNIIKDYKKVLALYKNQIDLYKGEVSDERQEELERDSRLLFDMHKKTVESFKDWKKIYTKEGKDE